MSHSNDHAEHHIIPMGTLIRTLLILAALMGLTILVYMIDFGHIISTRFKLGEAAGSYINNGIALTIACIKAVFVIQFFMGVKFVSKLTRMWAWAGFVWLLIMGMTFGDYWTRQWEPVKGWTPGDTEYPTMPSDVSQLPKPKPSHE